MDFNELFKELKKEMLAIFKEDFGDFPNEAKNDLEDFLLSSKDKLLKWTDLVRDESITHEEFAWLLESQKDLMLFHALYAKGISKIKLGHFKNKVIRVILSTVFKFI